AVDVADQVEPLVGLLAVDVKLYAVHGLGRNPRRWRGPRRTAVLSNRGPVAIVRAGQPAVCLQVVGIGDTEATLVGDARAQAVDELVRERQSWRDLRHMV